MAILRLDAKSLNLSLVVGVKEEYKPLPEIIKLSENVENLKEKTNKFISENWQEKTIQELSVIFKNEPKEQEKWAKYLEDVYNPELKGLLTTIDTINDKICPNYGEIKGESK